jgi:hypothetical protein
MNWPTSQDYNEAVQDPSTSFSDPGLKGGEVVVNALGLPVPRSGNFADVYQFTDAAGKPWALKCFTRKVAGLRERYAKIDEHLAKARLPFTVGFRFFETGVRVRGDWYPLLKMEWVEGFTLNDFVARNLGKAHHLHALMQMWAKLTGRLRDANMAHADLQHGNVLLVPGATPQKLGLKLIDYDGMWVPALAEHPSGEVGHPNYQHPLRLKDKLYTGDVDRFPHLVIAAALRATLVGGQAIWDKFDNGDNLLFREADLRDPGKGPVFRALWELNDPVLRTLVGHIALSAKEPLRKTPWLDDVLFQDGGPKLSADEERRVCELLGVSAAAPTAARATAVADEFSHFEFFDDDPPAAAPDDGPARPAARRPSPRAGRPALAQKSRLPVVLGGVGAGVVLVGVAVALAFGMRGSPPTGPAKGKGPDGATAAATTPKAARPAATAGAEKAAPVEVRITAVIDGKDELRLSADSAQWIHHSWQWPPEVKMNAVDWIPERTPLFGGAGLTRLTGKRVRDLSKARLTKVRGRGPVTLDATRDFVTVVFDDEGPLGADTYEVVLTFDP